MTHNLVIVESPAKARTIGGFLGKDYTVKASMGHVRDLPKSKIGIDVEHDFKPTYMIPADKKKVITDLKKNLKKGTTLYIATDEDREGEAIGWHLVKALDATKKKNDIKRIVFHEITKGAIEEAIENPRKIDSDLVDAQQARRVLDRLVGYELSPVLWKKIRYGLSAGRVQSVAVRLIVEREREIDAFKPEEYWSIKAEFLKGKDMFEADLTKFKGKDLKMGSDKDAKKALADLKGADYEVTKVEEKDVKRRPAPPFTTSTLQQEASRKLGFGVKKTMMIAQQLYEGVKHHKGEHGLITYMRTDSVNLSNVALKQAKKVIEKEFGKEYALDKPRYYKGKKGAQEAHEAIRPVDLSIKPEEAEKHLSKDQARLYELIWKRTLACQMAEAKLKALGVDITPLRKGKDTEYTFRATGQAIEFPGFIRAYVEGFDNPDEEISHKEKLLPPLVEGDEVDLQSLGSNQHFTKPPARYTEASLVKKLESEGIGRPSTYAPTIHTIMQRGYVEREQKQLKPTDLAGVVTDMLVKHFHHIVDYKFTAEMEEYLDEIAEGKKKWVPVIEEFYKPFHKNIETKTKTLKKEDFVNLGESDEKCEKCGAKMIYKLGKYGKFLSCSNYPECKNAKPVDDGSEPEKTETEKELEKKLAGKKCDKCGKPMEIKHGRYGSFLGCSGYPDCKNIKPIIKLIGVKCPKCKDGQIVERRTRKGGRLFYGCNKFPKCKYATWKKPGTPEAEEEAKAKAKKGAKKTTKKIAKKTTSKTARKSAKKK
jgi:DNA topoisomerase I